MFNDWYYCKLNIMAPRIISGARLKKLTRLKNKANSEGPCGFSHMRIIVRTPDYWMIAYTDVTSVSASLISNQSLVPPVKLYF